MPINTLERRDPSKLKNHHLNIEIYGDVADKEFVESCKAGILTPLVITPDNLIVSGHRRRQAAIILGFKEVPVFVRHDLKSDIDIRLALLRANDQREKTNEQKAREYEARVEIEKELAKQRQKQSEGRGNKKVRQIDEPFSKPVEAKAVAADSVGMARNTADKAVEVVHEIDKAESEGKTAEASELRETLNKNVSAAHRKVSEPKNPPEPEPVVDAKKEPVPEKLKAVFESRDEFDLILSKLKNIVQVTNTLAASDAGAHLNANALKADFDNLRRQIRFGKPHAVCPYCKAKKPKCECCKGLGWVTEDQYKNTPAEMRT